MLGLRSRKLIDHASNSFSSFWAVSILVIFSLTMASGLSASKPYAVLFMALVQEDRCTVFRRNLYQNGPKVSVPRPRKTPSTESPVRARYYKQDVAQTTVTKTILAGKWPLCKLSTRPLSTISGHWRSLMLLNAIERRYMRKAELVGHDDVGCDIEGINAKETSDLGSVAIPTLQGLA